MEVRPIDANALIDKLEGINPVDYGAMSSYETHNGAREALVDAVMRVNDAPTLSLNTLRDEIYQDAVEHGLWEPGALLLKQAKGDEKMASLALGVTLILGEAQEFVEAIDDPKKMEEELADVAIMCFSFAGRMGIDIDAAIRRKMEINKGRAWKHGKE